VKVKLEVEMMLEVKVDGTWVISISVSGLGRWRGEAKPGDEEGEV
jgi:hypothetical protein